MVQDLLYIGLDVDDKAFHGHVLQGGEREGLSFSCRPTLGALVKKLEKHSEDPSRIRICYEAGYLGFSLYRELLVRGYHCDVIAPSMIPKSGNPAIKTDRIDGRNLAIMHSKSLLTAVHVPEVEEERVRDLVRTRMYLSHRLSSLKAHILSLCRRRGLHFKQSTGYRSHWTKAHLEWLRVQSKNQSEVLAFNLTELLSEYLHHKGKIEAFDEKIHQLSQADEYREKVKSLTCYRGFSVIAAMAVVCEIGDVKRFAHPRQLVSYTGLGIREYSSGGKESKYGITRIGNKYLRATVVECAQKVLRKPAVGKDLKARRKGANPKYIKIADHCMARLNKKGVRMIARGKHNNKAKVACAREWMGFIWESLQLAQAA